MTDLTLAESGRPKPVAPEHAKKGCAPEQRTFLEVELPSPGEPVSALKVLAVHGAGPVDLVQEGANMLELQLRQSRCVTPLSISSKATQALLRQF